mgnify:CR=1 FL=1
MPRKRKDEEEEPDFDENDELENEDEFDDENEPFYQKKKQKKRGVKLIFTYLAMEHSGNVIFIRNY